MNRDNTKNHHGENKLLVTLIRTRVEVFLQCLWQYRVAVISAKNHKRQRRTRQSLTAKRKKSQTPKV